MGSGGTRVDDTQRHRAWLATALIVAIYVGLAIVCYWGAWSTDPAHTSLAGGDQYQATWYLAWVPFALLHGHNPFFSDYINYPFGLNTLTNTGIVFLGLLATPVTLLFGATAAYNTMVTLALASSATAGYVVIRRLTPWRPAAFIGGLLYGFSPYEMAEGSGHLHLSFAPLPPLMLLCLYEIVVGRTARPRRWAIALGLLATVQFFIASELLVDTALVGASALVMVAIAQRHDLRPQAKRILPLLLQAGMVAAVLLAYPIWFALRGPGTIAGPVQLVAQGYRADLLGPVVPDSLQLIAPHALAATADHFANNVVENGSYLGITLLIVMAGGVVWLWRLALVRLLAALGALWFVLSLGAALVLKVAPTGTANGLPLPERLLADIPLFANIIPVRFSLFVVLFSAILLAVILDQLHQHLAAPAGADRSVVSPFSPAAVRRAVVVPVVIAVIALVPLIPALPLSGSKPAVTVPFFTTSAYRAIAPGTPVLVFPYGGYVTPAPVVWQASTFMHFKMPGSDALVAGANGRIAFSVDYGYERVTVVSSLMLDLEAGRIPAPTAVLRAAVIDQMRQWHMTTVVATPGLSASPARVAAFLRWLFGPPATVTQGTLLWRHV
jgi:hypothetical protein